MNRRVFSTNIYFKRDILKELISIWNLSLSHATAREQMQQDCSAAQTPVSSVLGTECNTQCGICSAIFDGRLAQLR